MEDRTRDDLALEMRRPWDWLLLSEALMGPRLVVEGDELREKAIEVRHAEHKDVVEQFTAERADQALSEGVQVRRADRAADDAGTNAIGRGRVSKIV